MYPCVRLPQRDHPFGDAHLFRDHANSFPTPPILPKIMARRIALVKKILAVVWATLGLDLGNGGSFPFEPLRLLDRTKRNFLSPALVATVVPLYRAYE